MFRSWNTRLAQVGEELLCLLGNVKDKWSESSLMQSGTGDKLGEIIEKCKKLDKSWQSPFYRQGGQDRSNNVGELNIYLRLLCLYFTAHSVTSWLPLPLGPTIVSLLLLIQVIISLNSVWFPASGPCLCSPICCPLTLLSPPALTM